MSIMELLEESSDQSQSKSSQNDLSSDIILSYLREESSTRIHHKEVFSNLWVFWSKNEGSENNSSSADLHDKIKYAFEKIDYFAVFLAQLWAPVTIGGRRLLSTSGQPFAISYPSKELVDYRLYSEKCKFDIDVNKELVDYRLYSENIKYDIDVNNLDIEDHHNIKSGGPATAFLNRLPYISDPLESESYCSGLKFRFMLPICFHPQSDCIGVLEISANYNILKFGLYDVQDAVKEVGLHVCNVQEHISYKTINDFTSAKDEIKRALEIVCISHQILLAQVWIPFEDKSHMPLSSNSEETPSILVLKWTDYPNEDVLAHDDDDVELYAYLCDDFTLKTREEHVLKTLEDFKPRYISKLCDDFLINSKNLSGDYCAFSICLRSLHTGDLSFAFEFIWSTRSRCNILLEAILLTIKRCLPSFKLASGGKLDDELDVIEVGCSEDGQDIDDELDVIEVGCSEDGQDKTFKIFQGKRPSLTPMALEKGKQPIVVENIEPSEVRTPETTSTTLPSEEMGKQLDATCVKRPMEKTMVKYKTAEINLTLEDVEKHFDKTMKEAAKVLNVSQSTLKRKLRKLEIPEWPKRSKTNKSALSINQKDINEEDNGATQKPSTMIIKAEYAGFMIKISHLNSQATFETIKKEIGMKFNLSLGTYNLTYLDEDGDWILLTSDEELSDCIKSSRISDRIVIRLRVVLLSTNIQI